MSFLKNSSKSGNPGAYNLSMNKIVYLTVTSVPWSSAHSHYAVKMAQALAESGCETELVACTHSFRKREEILDQYRIGVPAFKLTRIVAPYGLKLPGVEEWSVRFFWAGIIHFFFLVLRKWVYQKKEIYICHNPFSLVSCALVGVPYVYDFHANQLNNVIIKRLVQWRPPFLAFVQSEGLLEMVSQKFPKLPLKLIRNAVSHDLLEIPPYRLLKKENPVIVYVGSLGEHRGVELTLRAFLKFREKSEGTLVIAGGKPEQVEKLRYRCKKLGLGDDVDLRGHVGQKEVLDIYRGADMFVAYYETSLPALGFMSPIKVFEYLAAGRCTVASNVPTIREIAEHGKDIWLVEPDNAELLHEAFDYLVSHPQVMNTIAQRARSNQNVITWEQRAQKMIVSIEEAINA